MSEFEINIELPGNQFSECLIIDKYQDQYGLTLAKKGDKGGTVWKKYCFPEYKKQAGKIAVPWKINIGSRDDARQVAKQIAEAFGWVVMEKDKAKELGAVITQRWEPDPLDDDQIPF